MGTFFYIFVGYAAGIYLAYKNEGYLALLLLVGLAAIINYITLQKKYFILTSHGNNIGLFHGGIYPVSLP